MKTKMRLRRKLAFEPPKPLLIDGLKALTHGYYSKRRVRTILFMKHNIFNADAGYCLDSIVDEQHQRASIPRDDTAMFLGMPVRINPFLGNRVVLEQPRNPNQPFIWFDNENIMSEMRDFPFGSGGSGT